jgi:Flp pilus assembly protein TadD
LIGVLLVQAGCGSSSGGLTPPMLGSAVAPAGTGELPPDRAAQACLAVAQQLDRTGNEAGAIDQYEKALRLEPQNVQAARRLAVLYDRRGEFAKADAEYRKAADALPRDPDLLNDWGYSYYLRNNWSEAEKKLRQALQLSPQHQRARCNLGLVLGQQERYPEALQAFRAAQLSDAEAHSNLGFIYWSQGRLDEARQQCRLALQKDSSSTKSRDLLAQLDRPSGPSPDTPRSTASAHPPAPPEKPALTPSSNIIYRSPSGVAWTPVTPPAPATAEGKNTARSLD